MSLLNLFLAFGIAFFGVKTIEAFVFMFERNNRKDNTLGLIASILPLIMMGRFGEAKKEVKENE